MKKQTYKKIGALWRAPVTQAINVLAVTRAVIGMVTYVGLYNPRASLASAKSPPTARAAPVQAYVSLPGYCNGQKVITADLSVLISSGMNSDAAFVDSTHSKDPPLEGRHIAVMHYHWNGKYMPLP